jgi:DNA-directed RNA polymerase subunit RPC12/RpoP
MQKREMDMSPEDTALFKYVKKLYNNGHHDEACRRFREIYNNGNQADTSLLCWIGYSTPNLDEAERALSDVERLNPYHPSLPKLRERVSRLQLHVVYDASPGQRAKLKCPYCGRRGMLFTVRNVSPGGWLTFVVTTLLFFPAQQIGKSIKTQTVLCANCGTEL